MRDTKDIMAGARSLRIAPRGGFFYHRRTLNIAARRGVMMRVITCNVNGIRSACSKGFWKWVEQQKADVVCLQEIKALEKDLPEECRNPKGFHAYFHPAVKPGYSGVALF